MNSIKSVKKMSESRDRIKRLLNDEWWTRHSSIIKYASKVTLIVVGGLIAWIAFLYAISEPLVQWKREHTKQHIEFQLHIDSHQPDRK